MSLITRAWVLCKRASRTAAALPRTSAIPGWAKIGLVFALLPIPGPFDEIAGAIIVFVLINSRHRKTVTTEWRATR